MKTLKQIREASGGKEAYQKFFNSLLKKFGVSSPSELKGDKKKEFYDAIDAGWEGDNEPKEKDESVKEALKAGKGNIKNLDVDLDASEYDGGEKAFIKDVKKRFKVTVKITRMGALLSGKKADVMQFLMSDMYGMGEDDLEDLFPELMETYGDPDNLDPDTTTDPDEEEINASYGKMNAGYIKSSYHKESVNEALSKLIGKAGRGKLSPKDAIDIDYMGDRKDIKFDSTKWKINIKGSGNGQALVSGDKKKIIAWLTSDDYGMDDEDVEDLFPELMESSYPKPLSVIRQVKEFSGDAETVRRKKRRFEKMVMCEHCGKMHEEGACGESMEMGEASRYSRDLRGPAKETFQKALEIIRKEKIRGDRDQAAVVDKIKGVLNDRDVRQIKLALQYESVVNEGVVNESEIHLSKLRAAKFAPKSKWAALKKKFNVTIDPSDPRWAQGKPQDLHKFAIAMGMSKNDIKKTYNHITPEYKGASNITNKQRESVEEAVRQGKKIKGAKLGKAYPVLDAGTQRKVKAIAKKHSGDMERALKDIEKLKKGLGDNPDVMDILRRANEDVNEAVAVDRRTKGFKDAMIRNEKAKKVREKAKKKKEAKKDQAELDARYDYDGEVDNIISAASKVMMGTNETAANAVAHGGVDMAPNAGKKKKKKNLMARRY